MTLGPVVAGARLAEHEVVRPEEHAVRTGPDRLHGAGLQVEQHGPRHVLAALRTVGGYNEKPITKHILEAGQLEPSDDKTQALAFFTLQII